jgi:hypothetical protein
MSAKPFGISDEQSSRPNKRQIRRFQHVPLAIKSRQRDDFAANPATLFPKHNIFNKMPKNQ